METINCNSNQSSYLTGIKIISFVEGNVQCKYTNFQLHPPTSMEDYSINISVRKKSNISSETAETVKFQFSHYKSMGTISCHSNQSSYLTGKKNTTFIEANVLSMHAKFQLHLPYGF